MSKVKSNGGSSSYYQVHINGADIECGDIIKQVMENDYDKGCMLKALWRLGKKEGTEIAYDLNKIQWHLDRLKADYGVQSIDYKGQCEALHDVINDLNFELMKYKHKGDSDAN